MAPYWMFAQDPLIDCFTLSNIINKDWKLITRSIPGNFAICEHLKERKICVFAQKSSVTDDEEGIYAWEKVADVCDSNFRYLRGVIGAQFDALEPLGDLVARPEIGASILFEREDRVYAVLEVSISWKKKASLKPTVEVQWLTPVVGDSSAEEFSGLSGALLARINGQAEDIRTFMRECKIPIPWDNQSIAGNYHRVDFAWVPKVDEDYTEEDECLTIVAAKRGRPVGKMDSNKRKRGDALPPSSKIACWTTIFQLQMLFPSYDVDQQLLAALFTLTKAFPDFKKWKPSEPLLKRFKNLKTEMDPMLLDSTYCFSQDFSEELRKATPINTMQMYDQCAGIMRAWRLNGSMCDYFRKECVMTGSTSCPRWYETNQKTLNAAGIKNLNAIISAEHAKKQCGGAVVVGPSLKYSEEDDEEGSSSSWNWLVETKQELVLGKEDAKNGLDEYYAGMGELNHEENERKKGHIGEVLNDFAKVETKLNEAISIFKASRRLRREMDLLNARKQNLRVDLNSISQHIMSMTDFCPPKETRTKAGVLFLKHSVDEILLKVEGNLQV